MRKLKDKTQELVLTELLSTVKELREDIKKSKQQEDNKNLRKRKK